MIISFNLCVILFALSLGISVALTIMGFVVIHDSIYGSVHVIIPIAMIVVGALSVTLMMTNWDGKELLGSQYDLPRMAESMNLEPQEVLSYNAEPYIQYMKFFNLEAYQYLVPEKPFMSEYLLESEVVS